MWMDTMINFQIPLTIGEIGKANRKKLTKLKNNISFQNTFCRLVIDALNRYDIEGLPDTISKRVVMQSLLWYGGVVFFEKDGSIFALPAVPSGDGFNVNGDPGSAWIFSKNGMFNEEIDIYLPGSDEAEFLKKTNGVKVGRRLKGVYVWENKMRFPFINQTIFFSQAISDTMRTLDVCRKNIKNPFIVTAEESVVPTVKKYFEDRDDNEEYIISSGIFDATKVSVIPLTTNSDTLSSCTQLIEWYENKYRELCGTDNNGQMDKKGENLIQAEVDINSMYTDLAVSNCLETLNEGMEDVNKILGLSARFVPKKEKEQPTNEQTENIQGNNRDNAGGDTLPGRSE